eukprot:COSAG04_NODE_1289_length_7362_cov_3.297122_6_plen_597_part_00
MKLKEAARVDALDTLQEEVTHVNEDAFKRIHDEKQKKLEEIEKKLKKLKEERSKLFEKYANDEHERANLVAEEGGHEGKGREGGDGPLAMDEADAARSQEILEEVLKLHKEQLDWESKTEEQVIMASPELAASFGRSGYSPRGREREDLELDLKEAIVKPMRALYADDAHDTTDHVTLEKLKSMVDKWPDDLNQLATKAHVVEFKRRIECLRDAINAKKEKLAKELKDDIAKTQKEWKDLWLPLQKHYQGDSAAKERHDDEAEQAKEERGKAYAKEVVRKTKVHEKWVEDEKKHNAELAIRRDEQKDDLELNLTTRIAFLKGLIATAKEALKKTEKKKKEEEGGLQKRIEALEKDIEEKEKEIAKDKEKTDKGNKQAKKDFDDEIERLNTEIANLEERVKALRDAIDALKSGNMEGQIESLIAKLKAEYAAKKALREKELADKHAELQQKYDADVKKIDDQIKKIKKEHAEAEEALEKEVLAPLTELEEAVEKIKTRIAALTENICKDLKEMRERQKLKVEAQCKKLEGDIQVKIDERNELFMKYMALEDGHLADIAKGVVTEAKHLPPVDQPFSESNYSYTPEGVPPQPEPEPQQ